MSSLGGSYRERTDEEIADDQRAVKRAKSKRSRLLWHFAVSTSLLGVRRRSECWRAGHCLCDSLGSC